MMLCCHSEDADKLSYFHFTHEETQAEKGEEFTAGCR